MGLLSALGLKPSRKMLAANKASAAKRVAARTAAPPAPADVPTAAPPGEEEELQAAPPAEAGAMGGLAGAKPEEAQAAPPVSVEGGYKDFGAGIKKVEGGYEVSVKNEPKLNVIQKNFKVYVVPCFFRVQVKATLEGSGELTESKRECAISVKGSGVGQLGPGGTSPDVTVGFYGAAQLSAEMKVPLTWAGLEQFAIDPFVVDVFGTGLVGMTCEVGDWSATSECELAKWHLAIINFGAYKNGTWGPVSIAPGKDIERIAAELQRIGPTIADAVEKYAPEKVKKAAEDGAKWVAESDDAKKIADKTKVVLDKIEEETGVDVGGGTEKVVQFLVDPDGETSDEATARVNRETAILNSSGEDFHKVMTEAGLFTGGPLASRTTEDVAEYNAIVAVKHAEDSKLLRGEEAPGAWRPMVLALVAKRTQAKKLREAQARAQAEAKQKSDADAAAADLARRIQQAEAQMNAAWQGAVGPGNTINNSAKAQPGTQARKAWEAGMMTYYNKGVQAKMAVSGLQGEQRLKKAQEATALFVSAAAEFKRGVSMLG